MSMKNKPIPWVYPFERVHFLNAVVRGLAVDSFTGKIYFTNNAEVEVVNPDGNGRARVMKHSNGARTYGVAVHITDR